MADTIFAQATPPGRSGVAVIRISGPAAVASSAAIGADRLPSRQAVLRRLFDPRDAATLDHALAIRFEAPNSFTGEDIVELQVHGGLAVTRAVSSALSALSALRPAEPGEFTRRALMNGKLDLLQVEGLGDLLAAETAAQAKQAIALMEGRLAEATAIWRSELVQTVAIMEALIDFSDEDVPAGVIHEAVSSLDRLQGMLAAEIAKSFVGERVRLGFEVALVGAPNVGKSTLLNMLAGREAAITSDVAGTTRDVIEVRMDIGGLPVSFLDTAGMRDTDDHVESVGIERARIRAEAADMRVYMLDGASSPASLGVRDRPGDIRVLVKADLRDDSCLDAVSGRTGQGVDALLRRIGGELEGRAAGSGLVNHERQQIAVGRALASLGRARAHLHEGSADIDLAVAELHAALGALDFLLGKVDVESVLDVVFARFCLGK